MVVTLTPNSSSDPELINSNPGERIEEDFVRYFSCMHGGDLYCVVVTK